MEASSKSSRRHTRRPSSCGKSRFRASSQSQRVEDRGSQVHRFGHFQPLRGRYSVARRDDGRRHVQQQHIARFQLRPDGGPHGVLKVALLLSNGVRLREDIRTCRVWEGGLSAWWSPEHDRPQLERVERE